MRPGRLVRTSRSQRGDGGLTPPRATNKKYGYS